MANGSPFSRTSRHFFQPLLPGFQTHLKIPVKFFSEHIEGKHEGKTVKLRTDASERTWEVKMEDHRITIGWKEFVESHDLRIGDIVVFRHEGDMLFHVTALGTSCCEIQYSPSRSHEEDEESDEIETSSRSEKEVEENVKIESDQSSTDLNCFTQYVTASNLLRDTVTVPKGLANRNGLNKERQEIVLMNEEGRSWVSELKSSLSRVCIVRGWTSFCTENKLKVGDSCTFRLLPNSETPVFQLCSRTKAERKRQTRSEEDYIDNKTGENRFLRLTLTPSSLEHGKQHLPVSFTRVNMLNTPGKIILVDKDKVEWPMMLKADQRRRVMYVFSGKGWKSFCAANEVGAGDSLTLELIRGGTSPLLKFCSKMEEPTSEADDETHKRARVQNWSQETRPKIEIREKKDAEGEASRASNKTSGDQNLQHTRACSVADQVAKVKQNVVDTLTSIRRFLTEFETMEQKLEVSLQEINNLEREEKTNGNKTIFK